MTVRGTCPTLGGVLMLSCLLFPLPRFFVLVAQLTGTQGVGLQATSRRYARSPQREITHGTCGAKELHEPGGSCLPWRQSCAAVGER